VKVNSERNLYRYRNNDVNLKIERVFYNQ